MNASLQRWELRLSAPISRLISISPDTYPRQQIRPASRQCFPSEQRSVSLSLAA